MMRTIAQCRGARGPAWQPGAITARGPCQILDRPRIGSGVTRLNSAGPMRAEYGPAGWANVTTVTFSQKHHEFAHLFGYRINRRPQGRHI